MFRKKNIYILFFIIIFVSIPLYTKKEDKKQKKTLTRAIIECGSGMAISQTNYWLQYSNWIEDWQYELNWKDQTNRIFKLDGQKFDSNCFFINWTHALSGAIYYNVARSNGLDIYESSIFTTIASLYWEFIVEWREVISINDNIVTSFGGISIGESIHQLGEYLHSKKGIVNNIAAIILNPFIAVNRWLDRNQGYTYNIPNKRNMNLFFGSYFLMEDKAEASKDKNYFFGFNSSLTTLPIISKKGTKTKNIKGTILSNIDFKIEMKDKSVEEISAETINAYFGKYKHKIKKYSDNYLKGYSYFYSLFSGFEYFKKTETNKNYNCEEYKYIDESMYVETPTEFSDKLSIINMIGPYSEFNYYIGKGRLMFQNSISFDFGLINAFALNKYTETEDISYTKATLYNYGYYYAFGLTLNSKFSLEYNRFNIDLGYKYQNYNSIEGLDRYQDKIKNDFNIKDTKSTLKFDIGYKFNILPLGLKFIVEKRYRKGIMKHINTKKKETKVYIRMDLLL